jgi:predicted metal-dependent peptidase
MQAWTCLTDSADSRWGVIESVKKSTAMDAEAAHAAIQRSMIELILEKPFYGLLLMKFRRRRDPALSGPMAIGVDEEGSIALFYNEHYMWCMKRKSEKLDLSDFSKLRPFKDTEMCALLEHEALHLIERHFARREWRDSEVFNVAADLSINCLITGLPPHALFPKDFSFPPNLSVEAYYDLLVERIQSGRKCPDAEGKTDASVRKSLCPDCKGSPLDSHDHWVSNGSTNWAVVEDLARSAVDSAVRETGGVEAARGYLPPKVLEIVDAAITKPYDWRPILRRFCWGEVKIGTYATWSHPHRRLGSAAPGRRHKRTGTVAVLIDTSASISPADLAQFRAEVERISQSVQVVVAECDDTIREIYVVRPRARYPRTEFKGGGGTVLTPVFEAIARKHVGMKHPASHLLSRAKALIVLTDGMAIVPKVNITGLPVMWAVTPGGKRPAEYGHEIHVGDWKEAPGRREP